MLNCGLTKKKYSILSCTSTRWCEVISHYTCKQYPEFQIIVAYTNSYALKIHRKTGCFAFVTNPSPQTPLNIQVIGLHQNRRLCVETISRILGYIWKTLIYFFRAFLILQTYKYFRLFTLLCLLHSLTRSFIRSFTQSFIRSLILVHTTAV